MSVTKIVLSILVVTYGSKASLSLDKVASKRSVGGYYDTLGDYYVEDPIMESYSEEAADQMGSDYEENNWEHDNGILARQLPETGEYKMNQDKKSQTWCKVSKVVRHLREHGFEFFPKSYSEYECLPHTSYDGSSENSIFSSDVCPVYHGRCISSQKKFYFLKRKLSEKCWKMDKTTIKVGCKCVPPSQK